MSEFRRRLLMILLNSEGEEDMTLYKTITLQEDHTSDSTGNAVYWANFLDIPLLNNTSDKTFYVAVFNNNTATLNYRADLILYYIVGTSVKAIGMRNGRSNTNTTAYSTSVSYYASVGTTIKVYALPSE